MKQTTKWIALLLLLCLTIGLAGCGKDTDNGAAGTDPVTYTGLSPETVYDRLQEAEDFVFINVMDRNVTGASVSMTYMLEKDGDLIRYSVAQDDPDDEYDASTVIYYDLGKNICLASDGKEWFVVEEQSGTISIAALIENCTLTSLLFEDDHYIRQEKGYQMKESAILEAIGSKTATVTGKMTADGDSYTFRVETAEAGNTVGMTTKVLFRSVNVEMPDYDTAVTPQSGNAAEDVG